MAHPYTSHPPSHRRNRPQTHLKFVYITFVKMDQIRGIEARSVCAFGREPRTIVLISEDGSFLTARFAEPGECERISYARFLRGAGGSDDEGDDDGGGGGGGVNGGGDGGVGGNGGGGGGAGGPLLSALGQPSSAQTPTSVTRRPSGEVYGRARCLCLWFCPSFVDILLVCIPL